MLRLTVKHVGLLLHIFAIFQINAQYSQPPGYPPWSSVPRPVYQIKHVDPTNDFYHVFGDRFEVPLSQLRNIYLAGYDTEIYQLKKDVENESVTSDIKVTFYLWTHHGFKFIGKLNTDLQTLKRNINKYHHYFQLKKVYIERYTKKQWRIDKLIMLPSKFSDDVVLRKYYGDGSKELVAVVEEPTVVTLPEPCEDVKQDKSQASQLKPEVKQSDVLIDIFKELTGAKDKINKNKGDIKVTNDETICKSDTATYNTADDSGMITANGIKGPPKAIIYAPEKSKTNESGNKFQTTVTPGFLTEYESQVWQTNQKDTPVEFGPETQNEKIQSVNYNLEYNSDYKSTLTPGVLTEYDVKFYQNKLESTPDYFNKKTQPDNVSNTNHGLDVITLGLFSEHGDISSTIQNNKPQARKQSQTECVTYTSPGNTMFWPGGAARYSGIHKNNQKGSSIYFGPNTQTGDTRYANHGLENITPNVISENKDFVPQVAETQITLGKTIPQINFVTYATPPDNPILRPNFNQYYFTNQQIYNDKTSTKNMKVNLNDAEYYKNNIHKSKLKAESNTQINYLHPGAGTEAFEKDNTQYNLVDRKQKDSETPTGLLSTYMNNIGYDNVKSEESTGKYNLDYTPTQTVENIMQTAQTHKSPGFITNIAGFGQYDIAEEINNDKIPIELKESQSPNVALYDKSFDYHKTRVNAESRAECYQNLISTEMDKIYFKPAHTYISSGIATIGPNFIKDNIDQTASNIESFLNDYQDQSSKPNINLQTCTSYNLETTPSDLSQYNIDQKQEQDKSYFEDIKTKMNTILFDKNVNKGFASQKNKNQVILDNTKSQIDHGTFTTLNSKMLNQYCFTNQQQNKRKATPEIMTKHDKVGYKKDESGLKSKFITEQETNKDKSKVYTNYVTYTSHAPKIFRPSPMQYFSNVHTECKDKIPFESSETQFSNTQYANNYLRNTESEVKYDFETPGVESKINIWEQYINERSNPYINFITCAPCIGQLRLRSSQYYFESPIQKTDDIYAKAIPEPIYSDKIKVVKSGLENKCYIQEQSNRDSEKPCTSHVTYTGPSTTVFERGSRNYLNGLQNADKIPTVEQPLDANLYYSFDQPTYLTHNRPYSAITTPKCIPYHVKSPNKDEIPPEIIHTHYVDREYSNQYYPGKTPQTTISIRYNHINENTAKIQLNNEGVSKQEPGKYSNYSLYYQTYPQQKHKEEKPIEFAQTTFYDVSIVETPSHIYPQNGNPTTEFNNHWSAKIKRVKPKPRIYKCGDGNVQQSVPDIITRKPKAYNTYNFVSNKHVQPYVYKGPPLFNMKSYSIIQNNITPNTFESQIKDIPLLHTANKQKSNEKFINPAEINYSTDRSKYLLRNTNFDHNVPITVSADDKTTEKASNTGISEKTKTMGSNKIPCCTLPQTYKVSIRWYQASPIYLPENKENSVSYTDSGKINYSQIDKINNVQNVSPVENYDYSAATRYEERKTIYPEKKKHGNNYFTYAQHKKQKPHILSTVDKIDNIQITTPVGNTADYSLGTYYKGKNKIYTNIHKQNKINYFSFLEDKKQNMETFPINANEKSHVKPCDISSAYIQTKKVKDEPHTINEDSINYVEKSKASSYEAYNSWIDLGKITAVSVNKNKVSLSKPNTFQILPIEETVPSESLVKKDTAKNTNYKTNNINLIKPTASSYTNYIEYQQPQNFDSHRQKLITKYEISNDNPLLEKPDYPNLAKHSGKSNLKYISCNNNKEYATYTKVNTPTIKKISQSDTIYIESNANTKELINSLPVYTQLPQKFLNSYDSLINDICYPKIASRNPIAKIKQGGHKSQKSTPNNALCEINNGLSENIRLHKKPALNPWLSHSEYRYHDIPITSHDKQSIRPPIKTFLPHSYSIPGTLHHFYSTFLRPNKYESKPTCIKNQNESFKTYNKDLLSPIISQEFIQPSDFRTNYGIYVESNDNNKENNIQYDTTDLGAIQNLKQPIETHTRNSGLEINHLNNKPSQDNVIEHSITTNEGSYDWVKNNVATNSDIKWDQFKNPAIYSQYKPSITIEGNDKLFNTINRISMPSNPEPCTQYQPSLTKSDQSISSFSESVQIPFVMNEEIKKYSPPSKATKRKTVGQNPPNAIDVNLSIFTDYSCPFVFTNPNKMSNKRHMLTEVIKSIETVQPISCSNKNPVPSNLLPSIYSTDTSYSYSKSSISSPPLYSIYKVNNNPYDPWCPVKKEIPKILETKTPITSQFSSVLRYFPNLSHSKYSIYSQPSYYFFKPTPLLPTRTINKLNICPYQSKPIFNFQSPITVKRSNQNKNLPDLTCIYAGSSTNLQPSYYSKVYSSVPSPSYNVNNGAYQLFESNVNPKSSIIVKNSNQNEKFSDSYHSYDGSTNNVQSLNISPKMSLSTSVPRQEIYPDDIETSTTDENSNNNEGLVALPKNIKTSIDNWLKTDQSIGQVTIPVGQISLARLPDKTKSYILKTDDPNIRIRAWKDKIKIVKVKLVLETQECSVINFLPEIVKGDYNPKEVQNIVKNYVKRNYGEPIVIKGNSFYKPYVVVYNSEMFKSNRCTILWPTFNSQLNCWTS